MPHSQNKFGRALKYYHAVLTHFNQFVEDQFDFHAYCLRRTSINAYMDLLKVEDSMYAEASSARGQGRRDAVRESFRRAPGREGGCFRSQIAAMSADEAQKFGEQIQATKERGEGGARGYRSGEAKRWPRRRE